jgi:hypothetical protein
MHVRAAVLAVLLAACCSKPTEPSKPTESTESTAWTGPKSWFEEKPVGSKAFAPIETEPDWIKNPPSRDGYLRVVGDNASNLREIATSKTWPYDAYEKRIVPALEPVVGADAAKSATKHANKAAKPVACATREEDGPNPGVPGNHFVQAWTLWEVAIDDVVAALPAEKRDAARAALAASK